MMTMMSTRTCGECTACCVAPPLELLDKPGCVSCPHLVQIGEPLAGCSIYPDRPQQCKDFECLWRQEEDLLDDADRPDKIGVIFSYQETALGHTILVWEYLPGHWKQGRAAHIIASLAKNFAVIVIPADEPEARNILGPPEVLAKANTLIDRELRA